MLGGCDASPVLYSPWRVQGQYQSYIQFISDINLMLDNCIFYNGAASDPFGLGATVCLW